MFGKPVTVTYLVDEKTNIGILDGKYVRFEGDVPQTIAAVDVADTYIDAGVRVPDEFPGARECVSEKIAKLQSVL